MFFFFSKFLTLFIFPLPLVILSGLILSWTIVAGIKKKLLMSLPFLVLWFFSTNFTSQMLISSLEDEFPPIAIQDLNQHDVAIVLGGMFNNLTRYPERPELNSSADRITDALALYKQKKINKILFTGGSGSLFFNQKTEADLAHIFFEEQGIPASDIIWESESRNTRENALFSSKLLTEDEKVILITSAFHMPRSVSEFNNSGITVTAYPTDFRTLSENTGFWENFIPLTGALDTSTIAIKEWIGRLAYWIF
jgi:uncharacterized SAM-binding protein YcdF (DUF218 family)